VGHADAIAAIAGARVNVLGSSDTAGEIERHLRRMGIGRVAARPLGVDPDDGTFVVAAPCTREVTRLSDLNAFALERHVPWLQVLPFDGRLAVVGPVFVPEATACRECYLRRRAACSGYDDDYDLLEREPVRAPSPPPLSLIAAGLASVMALRWLTSCDPSLPGRLYVIEAGPVVRLRYDHVLRVPRCGACGTPERAMPSPWFEEVA
jgi:bacteriocin biosynthesis cyclodehydratase domain-containing protein